MDQKIWAQVLTQNSDSEESIKVIGDGEEPIESREGIKCM